MKEMIQLNEQEAAETAAQADQRYVTILTEENKMILAGPAQFGDDFSKGPTIGMMAKGKREIYSTV